MSTQYVVNDDGTISRVMPVSNNEIASRTTELQGENLMLQKQIDDNNVEIQMLSNAQIQASKKIQPLLGVDAQVIL